MKMALSACKMGVLMMVQKSKGPHVESPTNEQGLPAWRHGGMLLRELQMRISEVGTRTQHTLRKASRDIQRT